MSDDAAEEVAALFTRSDGAYAFARWGRPIAPVVFGVEDASLPTIKGAIEAVAALAGHPVAEMDPELGTNLMLFFVRDWDELSDVPHLGRLIPGLAPLLARLQAADANQYRIFRFEPEGGIRAAFAFLRMDAHLAAVPAATLALSQAVQVILLWSDAAFAGRPPLLAGPGGRRAAARDRGRDPRRLRPGAARRGARAGPCPAPRRPAGPRAGAGRVTHRFAVRVYYEDTDLAGVVYYANYLRFIERGRSEMLRALGIDQLALREAGLVFVVRRLLADYLAPARLDDLLTVETEVIRTGGARAELAQRVLRGAEPLFAAEVVLAVATLAGRAARLPREVRAALAPAGHAPAR